MMRSWQPHIVHYDPCDLTCNAPRHPSSLPPPEPLPDAPFDTGSKLAEINAKLAQMRLRWQPTTAAIDPSPIPSTRQDVCHSSSAYPNAPSLPRTTITTLATTEPLVADCPAPTATSIDRLVDDRPQPYDTQRPLLSLQDTMVLQLQVMEKLNMAFTTIHNILDLYRITTAHPLPNLNPCNIASTRVTNVTTATFPCSPLFSKLNPALVPPTIRTALFLQKIVTFPNPPIPAKPPYSYASCSQLYYGRHTKHWAEAIALHPDLEHGPRYMTQQLKAEKLHARLNTPDIRSFFGLQPQSANDLHPP